MKKLSELTESIWSDMEDRGVGDIAKKEDIAITIVIDGETGCDIVVACDTLIDARDMLPNTDLIDGLEIPCVAVGDCKAPFNIAEAIAAGNIAARKI